MHKFLYVSLIWLSGAAILFIPLMADGVRVAMVNRGVIESRLRAGAVPAKERHAVLARSFHESGCEEELQSISKWSTNVICRLPGETDETIVVGAHTDFIDVGKGIVDDWSGSSLLPSLYQALKGERRRHTYEFVGFAGEERGLLGSAKYLKSLRGEERTRIKAFVNLECLGLTPTKVWVHRSTPLLVEVLANVANLMKLPLTGLDVDRIGDDDTHSFVDKKIAVISIHSVDQKTLPILHSGRDEVNAIHLDDYYDTYRLVAACLAFLDTRLTG